jgi:hypothetical protein
MADKKNTPNDPKEKSKNASKSKTLKQRLPKSKPSVTHTQEDYTFDSGEDTYYRDDLSGD